MDFPLNTPIVPDGKELIHPHRVFTMVFGILQQLFLKPVELHKPLSIMK